MKKKTAEKAEQKVVELKATETMVTVIAECLFCKIRKEIKPGEIGKDDMPMCPKCFGPMVAVSAKCRI